MNSFAQAANSNGGGQYVYGTPTEKPILRPLRHPLYDSEQWDAAVNITVGYNLFTDNTTFASAAAGRKTLADTNMPGMGQLGTPLEFDLIGFIGHLQYGIDIDEFNQFYNRGVFQWVFGQANPWLTIKLAQIPQGIAPQGMSTVANTTIVSNGWGVQTNFLNFTSTSRQARKIHSNERFFNTVSHPNGITPINRLLWTTYMLGIYYMQL